MSVSVSAPGKVSANWGMGRGQVVPFLKRFHRVLPVTGDHLLDPANALAPVLDRVVGEKFGQRIDIPGQGRCVEIQVYENNAVIGIHLNRPDTVRAGAGLGVIPLLRHMLQFSLESIFPGVVGAD